MKKRLFVVLCLWLTGCGTFDVRVQIVPPATATAPVVLAAPTATATEPPATATAPRPTNTMEVERPFTLATIQMTDTRHGWGVDALGRIVATSDGGGLWVNATPSEEPFARHSLFAFSDKVAWAVSSQFETSQLVWHTLDGGKNWKSSRPIPLENGMTYTPVRLQFPDVDHGWLLAQAQDKDEDTRLFLYTSSDGGEDWAQVDAIGMSSTLLPTSSTSMVFFDGQRGWLGGGWRQAEWLMLKTGDGGEIWGTDTFRLPKQKNIECDGQAIVEMRPGAMAVEVTCTIPRDAKYLYHHIYYLSKNTGPAWKSWAIPGKFISIDFLNIHQGWMLVASDDPQANKILQTRDGGSTWKIINKVAWKQAQFNFVTDKIGWAIVGNGFASTFFRTEDSGKNWIQVRPSLSRE